MWMTLLIDIMCHIGSANNSVVIIVLLLKATVAVT